MSPCTKLNSKWIKDLNIRSETINDIKENIDIELTDLVCREHVINLTPKARQVKTKINEWDYIKLKKTLHSKRNQQQNKKATNLMGDDICKQQLQQRVNIQNI